MLTSYFLELGWSFFASGWMQFSAAFFVAFLIMMIFGKSFVNAMRLLQKKGQPISENVPLAHQEKAGTPTMGGILVVLAILVGSILFMPITNATGWIALAALVMFAALGFVDDYKKVSSQSKKAARICRRGASLRRILALFFWGISTGSAEQTARETVNGLNPLKIKGFERMSQKNMVSNIQIMH